MLIKHTLAVPTAVLPRRDPFDRVLVAQARSEHLDLFTSDEKMLSAGLDGIQDARRECTEAATEAVRAW